MDYATLSALLEQLDSRREVEERRREERNLMRKMVWGLKFFAVGIALFVDFCSSAPDSCLEERQRLKSQVRKLENRVMVQQQQIQELRNGNTISLHGQGDENIDLGDRTQYADCAEIYNDGNRRSGIYKIQPLKSPNEFQVYCDMTEGENYILKINLADFEGEQRSALYKEFKVGDEEEYKLVALLLIQGGALFVYIEYTEDAYLEYFQN
ncbi:UNVERIFIED_CONTAM: hypothetical protein FKN15_076460 [Acipenser sinensis]